MGLKVGDKVKFLNEAGGGIVSKIVSARMVNVAVEDGFDIPTLVSDLVLIEPVTSHAESMFKEDFNVEVPESSLEIGDVQALEEGSQLLKIDLTTNEVEGVYLALVPQDQKWLITGMVDIYLVNHTPYDILFNLLLKNAKGDFYGYDYNSIELEAALLIDSLDREEMDTWKEGLVQVLYHNLKEGTVVAPTTSAFKIKSSKLNNENSYPYSALVNQKALVFSLSDGLLKENLNAEEFKDEKEPQKVVKAAEKKEIPLIDRYQVLPKIAEVDLHIGELIENISGMESRDMFALQKKYFIDCLESAILHNYKKVTFIHGVGNGILKNAIIKVLKDYEQVENQSASIAKFGLGAIDVLIKPWE